MYPNSYWVGYISDNTVRYIFSEFIFSRYVIYTIQIITNCYISIFEKFCYWAVFNI